VVSIGNFDGVHLGHRALIDRCHALSSTGDAVAVVTFEPLPRAYFDPASAPQRLSSPVERIRLLDGAGVDLVWTMRFGQALAQVGAEDFVREVLVEELGARHVVTGDDFRFGHRREGDLQMLRELGQRYGFASLVVATVMQGGRRVSSGAVREALAAGDFGAAAEMLGRPYAIRGRVLRGQQLGRKLGYPTANLKIQALPCPIQGIFAVRARAAGDVWRPAVASLGWRPTVGGEDMLLEVHFFDIEAELYGLRLEVEFVAKLRDEAHFVTIEEMAQQMKIDEAQARQQLGTENWITKTP
jgi:riboflavin kinase/FMN adenylyltransferase